jgi:hypothetical protein
MPEQMCRTWLVSTAARQVMPSGSVETGSDVPGSSRRQLADRAGDAIAGAVIGQGLPTARQRWRECGANGTVDPRMPEPA